VLALGLALGASAPAAGLSIRAAPVQRFDAIAFANAQVGWAGGEGGILATRDGGATWQRQYAGPAAILAFSALSPTTAWAVAADRLLGTTDGDGGAHWRAALEEGTTAALYPTANAPQRAGGYAGPFAVANSSAAYFLTICAPCGEGAIIITATQDGGRTWRQSRVSGLPGSPVEAFAYARAANVPIIAVVFPTATRGWIAGVLQRMQGPSTILHTADGGRTWVRQYPR
jgi:photosystem II stability/assembly factor-like uncharacterized protein